MTFRVWLCSVAYAACVAFWLALLLYLATRFIFGQADGHLAIMYGIGVFVWVTLTGGTLYAWLRSKLFPQ